MITLGTDDRLYGKTDGGNVVYTLFGEPTGNGAPRILGQGFFGPAQTPLNKFFDKLVIHSIHLASVTVGLTPSVELSASINSLPTRLFTGTLPDGGSASYGNGLWTIYDSTGAELLPAGAATAANQATLISHVDGVEALLTSIETDTTSMAGSLAGVSTAANQTTIIGHLDGVEALLSSIDGDTAAMTTSLAAIAAAASGTELRVEVISSPSLAVSATDLDVRDMSFATDSMNVSGSSVSISALPNEGQQSMANSISVAVASDQSSIPVAATQSGAWSMGHGKTLKTVTGSVSADTDIVAAVATKRIKVVAYALFSASTTANTITFQSNASTALWTVPLQAPAANSIFGANLAIPAPSFLFATVAGEKLTLDVSAAQTVTYSVTYFDDDTA